jgi:2-oxoglutarate ferredoxin oxidoreductase subunit gamma
MRTDVVMAGLGGQGLMTIGRALATAAMREGKSVSYLPNYSPEVRGGWANCTVVISDAAVGSPSLGEPSAVIALEASSLAKHAPTLRPGGLLLVNTTRASEPVGRDDIRLVAVPASEIADRLGDERAANVVMLGAYVAASGAVALSSVEAAIRDQLKRRLQLIDLNVNALHAGAACVAGEASPPAPLSKGEGSTT